MDSGSETAPGRRPTVVSLCCGAGGMDLGFFAGGSQGGYACDFNADAVAIYRRNLGDHVEQGDLTKIEAARILDADVWVAGPPCQPFSTAGKRAGSHDPRDMWPHVLRLLKARRPPFAAFEYAGCSAPIGDPARIGCAQQDTLVPRAVLDANAAIACSGQENSLVKPAPTKQEPSSRKLAASAVGNKRP